jgi:hypothetical protein
MHRQSFNEKFRVYLFIILIFSIFIYFGFKIFNLIYGPIIRIYSPTSGEIIYTDTFILKGNIQNAKNIYINGREIDINKDGDFDEELISKYPYTLIVINVTDKYGKSREKVMNIARE